MGEGAMTQNEIDELTGGKPLEVPSTEISKVDNLPSVEGIEIKQEEIDELLKKANNEVSLSQTEIDKLFENNNEDTE